MMGGFYNYGGFGWIGMILGLVMMLVIMVGLVLLVVWAVRRVGRNGNMSPAQPPTGLSARDIAQARYAKGEISREEYQQILSDLGH